MSRFILDHNMSAHSPQHAVGDFIETGLDKGPFSGASPLVNNGRNTEEVLATRIFVHVSTQITNGTAVSMSTRTTISFQYQAELIKILNNIRSANVPE